MRLISGGILAVLLLFPSSSASADTGVLVGQSAILYIKPGQDVQSSNLLKPQRDGLRSTFLLAKMGGSSVFSENVMQDLLVAAGILVSVAAFIVGTMNLWRYARVPGAAESKQKQWAQLFGVLFALILLIRFLRIVLM